MSKKRCWLGEDLALYISSDIMMDSSHGRGDPLLPQVGLGRE